MSLNAELTVSRGDFTLDARIRVSSGETLALLGPNGSGKSTLLAAIAGLLAPQRGVVEVNGRALTDVGESGRCIVVPPQLRRVGLLGQDPLLFPHLSAVENVAFGQRARHTTVTRAREHAHRWLADVGLAGFSERRPAELSGGQQQRVAIARALAAEPDVLLLDEPMAALDVETAAALRSLLRERLAAANLATVIVTHDVVDALVLADRVAILDDGRIVDVGDAAKVLRQPANRFAATLAGLNFVEGTLEVGDIVRTADGRQLHAHCVPAGSAAVGAAKSGTAAVGAAKSGTAAVGDAVTAVFPPSAVRLYPVAPPVDHQLSWTATVARLEPAVRGVRVTFVGDTIVAEHSAADLLALGIREGATVSVSVDATIVTAYSSRPLANVMG